MSASGGERPGLKLLTSRAAAIYHVPTTRVDGCASKVGSRAERPASTEPRPTESDRRASYTVASLMAPPEARLGGRHVYCIDAQGVQEEALLQADVQEHVKCGTKGVPERVPTENAVSGEWICLPRTQDPLHSLRCLRMRMSRPRHAMHSVGFAMSRLSHGRIDFARVHGESLDATTRELEC